MGAFEQAKAVILARWAINLGRFARTRAVIERHVQALREIASLDIEDGLKAETQGRGDLFRVSSAMKKVEDASAGLNPRGSGTTAQEGCQRASFVV